MASQKLITIETVAQELATSPFAQRSGISASQLVSAWRALGRFILDSIRDGKGVQLPSLATFYVSKALDAFLRPSGTVRPFFYLLEGRFSSVPQFKGDTFPASRGTTVPPSYIQIGKGCGMDRFACQRMVKELLAVLGAFIRGRGVTVRVPFEGVGVLFTNKDGRIQFAFDRALLEFVNHKYAAPRAPKSKGPDAAPADAPGPADPLAQVSRLRGICAAADKIGAFCIGRLQLEDWLRQHCGEAMARLDGRTVLGLMTANIFGKSGKFIQWRSFCDALEDAIRKSPSGAAAAAAHHHHPASAPTPRGKAAGRGDPFMAVHEETYVADGHVEEAYAHDAHVGDDTAGEDHVLELSLEEPEERAPLKPVQPAAAPAATAPTVSFAPTPAPGPAVSASAPAAAGDLDYYDTRRGGPLKGPLSTRLEVDAFNKAHFAQLFEARGWKENLLKPKKGEVTPKVGQDVRNVQAFEASRLRTPRAPNAIAGALDAQVRDKQASRGETRTRERSEAVARNEAVATEEERAFEKKMQGKRAQIAALKQAWTDQQKAKSDVRDSLGDLESKWPYVREHDPLAKLPLFHQPKYVRASHVDM